MHRFSVLILIFFTSFIDPVYSLSAIIEGNAPAFAGKTIRLSRYSDMITNRIELMGTASIDKEGHFSIQIDIHDTLSCILSIGFRKSTIYIAPGSHYNCEIDIKPEVLEQQRLPLVMQELPFRIKNLSSNDPNFIIPAFNTAFETFLETNATAIRSLNKRRVLDSLQQFRNTFKTRSGSFDDIYMNYKTADLYCMMNRWNDKVIYEHYLKDKPVLYFHPAYMDFFNVFFEHYLTGKSNVIRSGDLNEPVNQFIDLKALTDNLGRDSLLINERIRELTLLKNLGELYYHPDFQSQNVLELIRIIGTTSKYPEHRLIASNLIHHLTSLIKGSPAPAFPFTDQSGKERTPGDFKGKWIYLGFFTTWCENCTAGMKIISSLKKQFGNSMEFISICCNDNPLDLKYFLDNNKDYNWIFTNLGDSMEITEEYQVMTYPFYVLIDPDGNIFQYPARNPEQQLKEYFEVLLK